VLVVSADGSLDVFDVSDPTVPSQTRAGALAVVGL
jgi:hypothetical protein